MLRVCEKLVGRMMEALLQLEEERGATADRTADARAGLEKRMAHTLHALSLFCSAAPKLLLPRAGLLPHFLKYEANTGAIQHTCQMLVPLATANRRWQRQRRRRRHPRRGRGQAGRRKEAPSES